MGAWCRADDADPPLLAPQGVVEVGGSRVRVLRRVGCVGRATAVVSWGRPRGIAAGRPPYGCVVQPNPTPSLAPRVGLPRPNLTASRPRRMSGGGLVPAARATMEEILKNQEKLQTLGEQSRALAEQSRALAEQNASLLKRMETQQDMANRVRLPPYPSLLSAHATAPRDRCNAIPPISCRRLTRARTRSRSKCSARSS